MNLDSNDQVWLPDVAPLDKNTSQRPAPPTATNRQDPISDKVVDDAAKILPGVLRHSKTPSFFYENYAPVGDNRIPTGMGKSRSDRAESEPLARRLSKRISRVCLRGRQWRHAHDMTDTTATDPSPIDTQSVPKSDDHSGDLPRKESLTQRMRKSVDLLLRRNRNREQDQELPTPPPSPPPPKHEPVTVPLTTTMHAAGKSAGKTGRPLVSGPVYGTFVDSRVEGFHGPSPYALHPEVGHAMAQPDMISLPAGQREVAPLAKFFIYPTTAKSSASLTAKSRTSTNWSTAKIAPNDSVASSRRLSKRQSSQNIVNLSEKPSQLTTPGKRRKSSAASSRKMSLEGSRRLSKRQSFQNVSENPTRGEEATASIRRKSSTASSKKVSMESSRRPSKRQSVQNIPSNSWPEERGTSSISHVQRTHGKQRKSSKNVSRDESRKISQRQSVSNLPEKSLSSGFTPSNKSPMMLGSTTVPRTPAEPPPSILSEAKSKPLSTVEELDEFLFNTFSPTIDTKSTSRIDSRSSKIPVKKPSAVFKNPSQPPTPIQKLMRLSRIDLSASSSADTSSRREKPDSPATSEKKLTWSKQISLEVSPRGSQVDLKSERSQKNDGIKKDSDLGALQSGIGSDISVKASKTKWPDGSLKGSKIPSLTQSFQNGEKESSAKISAVSSRNRSKEKVSAKKSSEKYSYELPSPRRLESIPQSPFTMGSKKSTQNSAVDSATRKPGFPQQTGTGFQPEKLDTLVTIPNEPLIKHPKKSKSSSRVASATRTPRKFSETSKNPIAEITSIKSNKESTPGSRMSRRQSAEKLRIKSRGNSSAPSSRMSRQYSEDKFHDLRKLDSVNSSKEASRKHSGKIVAPPEPNVFVKISPRKDSLLHLPPRPSDTIPSQEAIPVINTITKSKSARNSLENLGSSAKSIASNSDVSTAALYVARMSKEGKTHQQPDPKSKLTAAKVRDIIQAKLSKTPLKNPLATSKAQREDILNKIESIIQDSGADNTVESPAGFIGQQLSTNEPTIMTMSKKNSPTSGKHLDKRNKPSLDVFQVEPTENRGSRKQEPVPSVLPTEASAQNPKAAGLRKTAKQRPLNTQNMQAPSSVRESRKWRHSHLGLTNAQWNPMTPINANLTKVKLSKKKQPSILKQMRDVEKRLEAQKPHRYNVNRYQHTPKPPPQPVATIAAQQQSRSIPTSTDTTFVTAHPMTLGARDHITQMHTAHRRGSARRPNRPGDIFSAAINSVPRNAPLPKPASFMKGKMPTATTTTTLVTVPVKKSDSPTHLDAMGRRRKSHNQQGFRQKHLQSQGFNVLARTMTPCQRAKLRRMHEARQKHGRQSLVTKTLYGHDDDDEYAVRHKTGSDTHLKSSASTSKKVRASLKNIALTHPSKKKASHHQLVPDDEDILTNTHQSADSENHNKTNDVTNPFNKRRPSGSHEDLQMLEILPLVGKKLETPSDTVVSRRGKGLKRVKKIAPVPVLPSLTSISEDNQEEKTVRHYISEGVSAATNFNTSYAPSAMISAAIQRMSPPTASSYTLQQIVTKVSAVDQDSNVTRQTGSGESAEKSSPVSPSTSERVSAATNFNTSYAPSAMISAAIQRMSPPTASSYTLQQIVTKVSAVDQDSNVTRQTGSGESAEKSSPASPSTSESQYSLSLGLKDKPEHRDELESESVLTEKMVQKMIKSASQEQTDAHESLKSSKRDAFKHSEDKKRSSKNYSNMSHNIQRILREAQREAVKPLRPKEPRREKPVSKRVSRTPSAIANRRRNSSNKPEEKLSRKSAKEIPRREFKGKSHSRTRLRNSKQVTRKSSRHSVRKSVSRSRASSSIDPRIYSSVDKFYKGLVAAKAALGPAYSNLIKASIHVGENTGSRTRTRSSSIRHRRGSSSSTDDSKQPREV
ncbi:unnamed protein product [Notodromas monacha]|uniref:Uncharacterized protein n=1 Tax=Notodromas monacha TaxID=399045 RepID=A0A7R9BFQ0_9CRUS|nr:unnamed protein product [Notodromas monacha]CAG0913649.1 unnamed protein product [Notodromas monacha]